MAVIDHIKIASAELMRAADLVKIEMNDLRRQKSSLERDLEARIAEDIRQLQHVEYSLHRTADPRQSSQLQAARARITSEVAELRANLREQQRNIENAIQQKSGMVNGLESQARAILA